MFAVCVLFLFMCYALILVGGRLVRNKMCTSLACGRALLWASQPVIRRARAGNAPATCDSSTIVVFLPQCILYFFPIVFCISKQQRLAILRQVVYVFPNMFLIAMHLWLGNLWARVEIVIICFLELLPPSSFFIVRALKVRSRFSCKCFDDTASKVSMHKSHLPLIN